MTSESLNNASEAPRWPLRRWLLALLFLTVAGGLVRWGVWKATAPVRPIGDEVYYIHVAANLDAGLGHGHGRPFEAHAQWPPMQSYLMSLVVDDSLATDPSLLGEAYVARLLTVPLFLGTLLVALMALLGRELFDERVGLLAGAVTAVYPTFVAYSHYLWSETTFLFYLVAGLVLAVHSVRRESWWSALLAGVAFGLGTLTREIALLLGGAAAAWAVVVATRETRRAALARAVAMLAIAGVVVAPWTIRNWNLYGRLVPVSTVSWMGIAEGNLMGEDWLHADRELLAQFRQEHRSQPDDLAAMDFAKRTALERIRAEQPAWAGKKLVRNTAMLLSPDSFVFKKLTRDAYGEVPIGRVRLVLCVTVLSYVLVFVGAVLGIAGAKGRGRRLFPLACVAIVVGLHVFAQATSRYRLPIVPIMIVYASYAAWHARELWSRTGKRERVLAAAALLAFLGWWVPYFGADFVSLWKNGKYVNPLRP